MTDANGNEVPVLRALPAEAAPGMLDMDVANGPQPGGLSIVHIARDTFRVSWSVECSRLDCLRSSGSYMPFVLSSRWSVSESIDDRHFTQRSIDGQISLTVPVSSVQSDFRWLVVPGLEPGFRRDRLEFTVEPSGLKVRFRIVDTQTHAAPPWPAVRWDMTATEEIQGEVNHFSDVHVRLEGAPNSDRKLLISRAMQCLEARLRFMQNTSPEQKAKWFLENARIVERFGDANMVEASARVRRTPDEQGGLYQVLKTDVLGADLQLPALSGEPRAYDPTRSPVPAWYGYDPQGGQDNERRPAVLWLLQCYLQEPCVDRHGIAAKSSGGPTVTKSESSAMPTQIREMSAGSLPCSQGNEYSDGAKAVVYTLCRLQSDRIDDMMVGLPIAAPEPKPDSTTPSLGAPRQPSVKFIRLGRPRWERTVTFDCESAERWPEIPEPVAEYTEGDAIAVRKRYRLTPQPPTLAADGRTRLYRIAGEYVYQFDREPEQSKGLRVGVLAFTKYEPTETRFVPSEAFSPRLGP
jgi:hypothetical protein